MRVISPRVTFLSRADWGARHSYRLGGADDPRGGRRYIAKSERTHHVFHHSVIVDTDVSKNIWETLAKVRTNMRVIQDARPDLGGGYFDVPYNWVAYLRPNGKLTVCEGRGIRRSAAHTAGRDVNGVHHNISSPATCIAGNTELGPALDPWSSALNDWLRFLKHTEGISTIDLIHPPRGARAGFRLAADTYGHRHLDATACPGEHLWRALPQLSFEEEEEEDMVNPTFVTRTGPFKNKVFYTEGGSLYMIRGGPEAAAKKKAGIIKERADEVTEAHLTTLRRSYGHAN